MNRWTWKSEFGRKILDLTKSGNRSSMDSQLEGSIGQTKICKANISLSVTGYGPFPEIYEVL